MFDFITEVVTDVVEEVADIVGIDTNRGIVERLVNDGLKAAAIAGVTGIAYETVVKIMDD